MRKEFEVYAAIEDWIENQEAKASDLKLEGNVISFRADHVEIPIHLIPVGYTATVSSFWDNHWEQQDGFIVAIHLKEE